MIALAKELAGFLRSLAPLGRAVIAGLLLAVLIAGTFGVRSCQSAQVAKTQANLSRNQTGAAIASGADAVGTLSDQIGREVAVDATTKENADAIRSAPGADALVSRGVDAVARERLCRRAVYRVRPECLQFPAAD